MQSPANKALHTLIEWGTVLTTAIADGTKVLLAQVGDPDTGMVVSDQVEIWQQPGLAAIPPNSSATDGCDVIYVRRGSSATVVAMRDPRTMALAGALQPGETCLAGGGSDGNAQGRVLLKANGSINLYTTSGNTPGGAGMVVMLDPGSNTITLLNGAGNGIVIGPNDVKIVAGNSALVLGSNGNVTLVGTGTTQVDGGSIVIGSKVIPVVNAALHGPTGLAAVPSVKVLIE